MMLKKTLLVLMLAMATNAMAENHPLTPANLTKIEALQRQANQLSFDTTISNQYALSKAQAWLNLALREYYETDYSGIVQGATQQAELQLKQVNNAVNLAENTPHPYGSEQVRADLWSAVASYKQQVISTCAGNKSIEKQIATLEVQLVLAGHEQWESGALHAADDEKIAENMAEAIEQALNQCMPKEVAVIVPETIVDATVVRLEKHTLEADALFAFDRYGIEYLVENGKRKLDALILELGTWKAIDKITINGHTDKIGTKAYNLKLSRLRAEKIKHYLTMHGASAQSVEAIGLGESLSIVECNLQQASKALIACMQPNRRVELVIMGEK